MRKKVLIPLDGTPISEMALDQIDEVGFGDSDVTLLRVIPPVRGVIVDNDHKIYVDEQMDFLKKESMSYLESIAKKLEMRGFNVKCEVRFGQPAEEIANYAEQEGIGLIAMATHGRTSFSKLIRGSTMEKVKKLVDIPILVVKASESRKLSKAA